MKMLRVWVLAVAFVPAGSAFLEARQDGARHPGVDQKRVDAAIAKGVEWLSRQSYGGAVRESQTVEEIVLFTLLHAGISSDHPFFQGLLKNMLERELKSVYCVAFQAMVLSELDPSKYQWRIAQCCQFLVDNQTEKGNWAYGQPTTLPAATPSAPSEVKSGARPKGKRTPVKPRTVIQIKRQKYSQEDPPDNSNSQYAALGFRACMEANVWPPQECLELALKFLEGVQCPDGGWHYRGKRNRGGYGSMTAGAVGSLIIYRHYLKQPWRNDPAVQRGLKWMEQHFTVKEVPNDTQYGDNRHLYYYLYAIERLGIFGETPSFGLHDWYREGANELLSVQKPDGAWPERRFAISDTCFAILFLNRATIPLVPVATSGGKR